MPAHALRLCGRSRQPAALLASQAAADGPLGAATSWERAPAATAGTPGSALAGRRLRPSAKDAGNALERGQPLPAHVLRLCGRRRSRQRSWQVRRLPMGHLGLHHRGNVRLRRPQAHPAAHWQAGDCGHGARDSGNELGWCLPSHAHASRLCGRSRQPAALLASQAAADGPLGAATSWERARAATAGTPGSALAGRRLPPSARDAGNALERGQPLPAHALRLCGRSRQPAALLASQATADGPLGAATSRERAPAATAGTPGSALAGRRLPRR